MISSVLKKAIFASLLFAVFNIQVAQAYCSTGIRRSNWSTSWSMGCSIPTAFETKISQAIGIWDVADKYTYTAKGKCPPYAFNFQYGSFAALGFGSVPATTPLNFGGSPYGVTGASSYFNSDKTWYDSSVDNQYIANQYDRRTAALHEIGHWMYLQHPNACPASGTNDPNVDAVMDVKYKTRLNLRADDLAGLSALGIKN